MLNKQMNLNTKTNSIKKILMSSILIVTIAFTGIGLGNNAHAATVDCNLPASLNAEGICVGTAQADTITGTTNDDEIAGGPGVDTINARNGDDIVSGNAGNDNLDGQQGDDVVIGGAGSDAVRGGQGDDETAGGAGNDNMRGGQGSDAVFGGAGDDTLDGNQNADGINCGTGQNDNVIGFSLTEDVFIDANGNPITTGTPVAQATAAGCEHVPPFKP